VGGGQNNCGAEGEARSEVGGGASWNWKTTGGAGRGAEGAALRGEMAVRANGAGAPHALWIFE